MFALLGNFSLVHWIGTLLGIGLFVFWLRKRAAATEFGVSRSVRQGWPVTRTRLISMMLFVLGLIGVAIVTGIFPHGGSISGDSPVVALVISLFFFVSLLLVLVQGCVFLSDLFPSGEREQEKENRLRLGVLSLFPLAVGLLNSVIEQNGLTGLDVPQAILNGAGVTVALWFLYYCIRDLTARKTPAFTTVIWVSVLLLGNVVAIPVYWWLYLRRRPTRQVAVGSA